MRRLSSDYNQIRPLSRVRLGVGCLQQPLQPSESCSGWKRLGCWGTAGSGMARHRV